MPEAKVFGFECKAWYDSANDPDTPAWVELEELRDVTLAMTFDEADSTVRAGGGMKTSEPSLNAIEVTAELEYTNGSTNCEYLRAAYMARTVMNMRFLTGASNNADAKGVAGDFCLHKFDFKQPLGDTVKVDLTFKPARSLRDNFVAADTGVGA